MRILKIPFLDKTFHFRAPPIIPGLFTLLSLALLCALGTWQMDKYLIKTADSCAPSDGAYDPPISDLHTEQFNDIRSASSYCTKPLRFQGTLDMKYSVTIGPRMHKDRPGYYLYAPLTGDDDTKIYANLGWLPGTSPNANPEDFLQSGFTGPVELTGYLKKAGKKNMFTPAGSMKDGHLFAFDMKDVQDYYAISGLNEEKIIHITDIKPAGALNTPFTPAALKSTYLEPGRHLQYALFWFSMAVALLIIFTGRFMIVWLPK